MTIPSLQAAANDFELAGPPLSIYLYLLHEVLDLQEFRPVKRLALANRLHCHENTVQRALNLLVDRGYLDRGKVKPTEARTYRLVYSRMP